MREKQSALNAIKSFPETDDIVRLRELEGWHGTLTDIIEPDGEDIILARIAGELVELPMALSEKLWGRMGQRVVVGLIDGQHHVGRRSP